MHIRAVTGHVPRPAALRLEAERSVTALVAALLLASMLAWFVLDPLKYRVAALLAAGAAPRDAVLAALAGFGAADLLLTALAAGLVLLVIRWEVRGRELSQMLAAAGSQRGIHLLLAGTLLWLGHSYLYPGYLLAGDASAHVVRVSHVAAALSAGKLPMWNNFFSLGSPYLQFTGPLLFWLAGPVALVTGDPTAATKLVLLCFHLLGGLGFYALAREIGLARAASLLGALAFSGSFAHLHVVLVKGNLPQAITLALLPLTFLFVERVGKGSRAFGPSWAGLAVCLAAQVWNHQPTALIAGLFTAAFVLAGVAGGRYGRARLLPLASAALAGAMLALPVVLPIFVERSAVMMESDPRLVFWHWPGADLARKLLAWNYTHTGEGFSNAAYLGVTVVALALAGLVAGLRDRRPEGLRAVALAGAACALLSLGLRGAHVREILFILFFVALLAALGAGYVLAGRRAAGHLPALALGLLLVDLSSTSVQPLSRADKGYIERGATYLARLAPAERVLYAGSWDGPIQMSVGDGSVPFFFGPVPNLTGPFNLTDTRLHNYAAVAIKAAESDLEAGRPLSPFPRRVLALYGVTRIVGDGGAALGLPRRVPGTVEEGPLGRTLRLRAAPAVFAPRLVRLVPPAACDKPALRADDFRPGRRDPRIAVVEGFARGVLARMDYDETSGFAAALPVRELPAGMPAVSAAAGASGARSKWKAGLLSRTLEADRAVFDLRSERAGYVQLAHAWYPSLVVERNGVPVAPLHGTLGLVVLPVVAGRNVIEIEARLTPLRRWTGWIALLGLAAVVGLGTQRAEASDGRWFAQG